MLFDCRCSMNDGSLNLIASYKIVDLILLPFRQLIFAIAAFIQSHELNRMSFVRADCHDREIDQIERQRCRVRSPDLEHDVDPLFVPSLSLVSEVRELKLRPQFVSITNQEYSTPFPYPS
jgi:hypothetical protein